MKKYCNYHSPFGEIIIASEDNYLIGLWFEKEHSDYFNIDKYQKDVNDPTLIKTKKWLDLYFGNQKPNILDLRLKLIGTPFQKEVWEILIIIPYGQLITYGDIAKTLAKRRNIKKMSARAVGGAVGSNNISIIIPCHRVIGSNNNLTGYGGGIDKKIELLEHEGVKTSNLKRPR